MFLFLIVFLLSPHVRTVKLEGNTTHEINDISKRAVSRNLPDALLSSRNSKLKEPDLVDKRRKSASIASLCDATRCYSSRPVSLCSPLVFCAAYYEEIQKKSSFCKIGTNGYGAKCGDFIPSVFRWISPVIRPLRPVLFDRLISKPNSLSQSISDLQPSKLQRVRQRSATRDNNFRGISSSQAQKGISAAKLEFQKLEKFEQTESSEGVITNQNTPEFIHAQFFKTTPEAIEVSKTAILQNLASSSIKESLKLTNQEAVGKLIKTDASVISSCPRPPFCTKNDELYRRHDGSCNNMQNPSWGKALTPFLRKTNFANYDDGISIPRKSVIRGKDLPSARKISSEIVKNLDKPSSKFTLSVMQWGQFVDHDLTHTPISAISKSYGSSNPIQCCGSNGLPLPSSTAHSQCFPIIIPDDDLFYSRHNRRCMNFVRSLPAPSIDCKLGPRNQMNQVSHYLDGSAVYGSSTSSARSLRSFRNGLLKEQGDHLLPNDPKIIGFDFLAGDTRVNEQPHLSIIHTLWLRQHNRIANELHRINSAWSDEVIYQEARRIVIAQIQHIVYNEWLPIILGIERMKEFRLLPQSSGFLQQYSEVLDASINNEFATVAFRFGHTLIQGNLGLFDEDLEKVSSWPLADNFDHPILIKTTRRFDELLRGLFKQPMQKFDRCFPDDITNKLFKTTSSNSLPYGLDLIALNIQRGRDHGVGTYNDLRSSCGLPKVINFAFLDDNIDPKAEPILQDLYDSVEDIDPFIAGVSEPPYKDGILGRLFNCIVSEQFQRLKYGDRFYYENGGLPSSFKEAQLNQIRKTSWARIICDNSDGVTEIQPLAFRLPDTHNKKVPCSDSAVIPTLNLNYWRK